MKVLLPVRVLPGAYCSPGGHIICRCQYLGPYNCNGPILHSIGFAKEVEEANDKIYILFNICQFQNIQLFLFETFSIF